MRTLLLVLVIVLYSSPVLAQNKIVNKKVVDTNFIFVNGFMASGIILDVESTYTCTSTGKCIEANPFMRPLVDKGRPAMYAVQGAVAGLVMYSSYDLKKRGSKIWWLPPVIVGALHTAVGINNMRISISISR